MRNLFIISTLLFWLALSFFWIASEREPGPKNISVQKFHDALTESTTQNGFTLIEVATHNREKDCWMAIEGQVYNVTNYLPSHPSDPAIVLPWCGKEASLAWQTKSVGRPHTTFAVSILRTYAIGPLLKSQ
jgi:cytochrome b involved in lipid metabolism